MLQELKIIKYERTEDLILYYQFLRILMKDMKYLKNN